MTFVESLRDAFRFLSTEFGFAGPRIESGPASMSLGYVNGQIGVRAELDVRENSVDVVLARLIDGRWPARSQAGWVYLDRVARSRGVSLESGAFRYPQTEVDISDRVQEEARILRNLAIELLLGDGDHIDRIRGSLAS